MEDNLYSVTPLIESTPLTNIAGIPVYMKLENAQPTSSFKQRGMSYRCKEIYKQGYREVITSSGGNAGISLAYCARKLGMKATIVILKKTSDAVRRKLKEQDAQTKAVEGECWDDGDIVARKIAKETGAYYVHPFDHPDVWEGCSTIITEIANDLKSIPSVVITCVGGGGLLCGLIQGMHSIGWNDVPIIAMETEGAASFNASVKAGKLVTLPKMTSIALTLGAATVCSKLMEYIHTQPIFSELVSDKVAVSSCIQFANDHRILVEPSCGAALSAIYSGVLSKLIKENKVKRDGPAVIVVCGGNGVDLDILHEWKEQFGI